MVPVIVYVTVPPTGRFAVVSSGPGPAGGLHTCHRSIPSRSRTDQSRRTVPGSAMLAAGSALGPALVAVML